MRLTHLQLTKFLRKSASRQPENFEKIIQGQKQIELELIKLRKDICKGIDLPQKTKQQTQQIIEGAFVSALIGCVIVFCFEFLELVFPAFKDDVLYVIAKAMSMLFFTLIYVYRRLRK